MAKKEKFERVTINRKTTVEFSVNDKSGLSINYNSHGYPNRKIIIKRRDKDEPENHFWVVPASLEELSKIKIMIDEFLKVYEQEIEHK